MNREEARKAHFRSLYEAGSFCCINCLGTYGPDELIVGSVLYPESGRVKVYAVCDQCNEDEGHLTDDELEIYYARLDKRLETVAAIQLTQ